MIQKFRGLFDTDPLIAMAPGRINLFGEHHTGFALTAAVSKYVQVAVSRREDDRVLLHSLQFNERFDTRLADIRPQPKSHGWPNYVLGVLDQFLKKGHRLTGFSAVIDGDIPLTAGLSSSAALSCATILAISEVFDMKLSRLSMALIAQSAGSFAGVPCDLIDTYTGFYGKKGHAIKFDAAGSCHEYLPLQLYGYSLVLFDTGIAHSVIPKGNSRRGECEEGLAIIRKHEPVTSLAEVTLPMLHRHVDDLVVRKRCGFIIRENARLLAACGDLRIGDIESFGRKLFETHDGLSRDYGNHYHEVDFLADAVRNHPAVAGARMIGVGTGGCTVNIVRQDALEEVTRLAADSYREFTGKDLKTYVVDSTAGAAVVHRLTQMNCNN